MSNNMNIWNAQKKTDPAYTKKVNQRGGYTAISPQYQAMKATEQFGPYGLGWGLAQSDFDTSLFEAVGMITHKAVFFYVVDGQRVEFPISNAIKPTMGKTAIGDEDWAKKVETNTISKALSRLGFSADIFMGEFDDESYVHAVNVEKSIEKAEKKDAEVSGRQAELSDYIRKQLDMIAGAKTLPELSGIHKVATRHLTLQGNVAELSKLAQQGLTAIARDTEAKKSELEQDK